MVMVERERRETQMGANRVEGEEGTKRNAGVEKEKDC
jgi:hypothetical protein